MSKEEIECWIEYCDADAHRKGYKAASVCLRDAVSVGLAIAFAAATNGKADRSIYVHSSLNALVIGVQSEADGRAIRKHVEDQKRNLLQLTR